MIDVETFYKAADRFALAMQINNLLAAPGFDLWLKGDPLDMQRMLVTPEGKPRVSIFSIAHLSDAERMFFVTLLSNAMVAWMRAQSGTSSLRALYYMDEIFGFFPPVAEPPSKKPLLTLLKQARAAGLGVVLATQNPADLDYKGLSNAGTWLIGRLQADRDKQRLLDGLEGAAASGAFDRAKLEQTIAGLGKRVFLMNNVHESEPVVFESRFALSYLRGPLTRDQIRTLMAGRAPAAAAPAPAPAAVAPAAAAVAAAPPAAAAPAPAVASPAVAPRPRPMLPPDVPRYYIPLRGSPGRRVAPLRADDDRQRQRQDRQRRLGRDAAGAALRRRRDDDVGRRHRRRGRPGRSRDRPRGPGHLRRGAGGGAHEARVQRVLEAVRRLALPHAGGDRLHERAVQADVAARRERGRLPQPPVGDRTRAARRRGGEAAQKYGAKKATLDERIRRAQQAVDREAEQARGAQVQTAISLGSSILSAVLGRKSVSGATSVLRGVGRSVDQQGDTGRAKDTVGALQAQQQELDQQFQADTQDLDRTFDPLTEPLETQAVRPKKADIDVRLVALAFAPHWRDAGGTLTAAWR